MKIILPFIFLFFLTAASAQTGKLLPIEQAGWRMVNYDPHSVNSSETGSVDYKITLTKQGTVKRVTLLKSTFTPQTEKKWRDHINTMQFERASSVKPRKKDYRGTISLSTDWCSPQL
jgi:hypothetical protein